MIKFLFHSILCSFTLLCAGGAAHGQAQTILLADSSLNAIVNLSEKLEILDTTFQFTEGPVWHPDGYLLFSDIPANRIIRWDEENGFADYLNPSNNTNGLTFDAGQQLVMCSHGARQVLQMNQQGEKMTLADTYRGLRLNSPNDLVFNKKGWLYFTDPCWGLPKQEQSEEKELSFNGVYLLKGEELMLIDSTLWRPNGIALSPDQKYLYVSDMFTDNQPDVVKTIYKYQLDESGIPVSRQLIRVHNPPHEILGRVNGFDGLKTDVEGNIYCTGPHGIVILNEEGHYLGTIQTPLAPANCAWGGNDYQTLYITARRHLYRIHLNVKGNNPVQ